ncbi:hypothetical protein [Sulfobacillus thermosulfidooxidans]|uniref:hypothetical protein n=1 Tax=Sulfobacillus thermosulfidooxidans TaxID=28034 RepID=UPI0006B574CA|nr:hypothetical protein [Sulfobacillus thermosulfidooxidans]
MPTTPWQDALHQLTQEFQNALESTLAESWQNTQSHLTELHQIAQQLTDLESRRATLWQAFQSHLMAVMTTLSSATQSYATPVDSSRIVSSSQVPSPDHVPSPAAPAPDAFPSPAASVGPAFVAPAAHEDAPLAHVAPPIAPSESSESGPVLPGSPLPHMVERF